MRNPFSASTTVADADDAATAPGPQFPGACATRCLELITALASLAPVPMPCCWAVLRHFLRHQCAGDWFLDWRAVFADASKAVFVDVGSARGMFVETMATQFPQRNYLGVEIRSQLVQEALDRRAQGARNLHHITGEAAARRAATRRPQLGRGGWKVHSILCRNRL